MSLAAVSWAIEQKLPPAEKVVLIALADSLGGDEDEWFQIDLTRLCYRTMIHMDHLPLVCENLVAGDYLLKLEDDATMFRLNLERGA